MWSLISDAQENKRVFLGPALVVGNVLREKKGYFLQKKITSYPSLYEIDKKKLLTFLINVSVLFGFSVCFWFLFCLFCSCFFCCWCCYLLQQYFYQFLSLLRWRDDFFHPFFVFITFCFLSFSFTIFII